jgi:DNA repair protein RadA
MVLGKGHKSNIAEDPKKDVSETIVEEIEEISHKEPELDLSVGQLEGVGGVTTKKLETFGVSSLIDICIRGGREISEITGVTKAKADGWVFNAQKILEDNDMIRKSDMDVIDLMEYQENLPTIPTNCVAIDELFGGGIKPECVYEVYGEFGSGKTQFCNTLTVESINNGDNVVWIDCEDTFRPRRIIEILKAKEYAETREELLSALKHISYFYTPNTEQLLGTVNALSKTMEKKKPKLVVLDGAIGQFREEYLGRGTLADRQNQIARLMTHIKNISYYFRCTVIFTNQVQTDPSIMFGDPVKPIGGNVVGHAATYRVYFKKSGKKRIARMVDSPEHPISDAEYRLTAKGVEDIEE